MSSTRRLFASLSAGCIAAIVVAAAAFALLKSLWPDYAAAEPTKDYDLAMLLWRLGVGVLTTSCAAAIATVIAADDGKAAWLLGALFVVLSLPSHLYFSWDDYPVWYHCVYLLYLVPIAGLAGRGTRGLLRTDAATSPRSAPRQPDWRTSTASRGDEENLHEGGERS